MEKKLPPDTSALFLLEQTGHEEQANIVLWLETI